MIILRNKQKNYSFKENWEVFKMLFKPSSYRSSNSKPINILEEMKKYGVSQKDLEAAGKFFKDYNFFIENRCPSSIDVNDLPIIDGSYFKGDGSTPPSLRILEGNDYIDTYLSYLPDSKKYKVNLQLFPTFSIAIKEYFISLIKEIESPDRAAREEWGSNYCNQLCKVLKEVLKKL